MTELNSMGKRIRKLRELRGYTQNQMAEKLKMNPANFSSYERDKSIPPSDRLALISDILLTSMDYLAGRAEENLLPGANNKQLTTILNDTPFRIPLVGTICAGEGLIADENVEDYIYYPIVGKKIDYALRVKGDSMEGAGINDGDIVFLRNIKWAEYNGQIVAAVINGEEGVLKKMKWEGDSPIIRLEPANSRYKTIEVMPNEIVICGVYEGHFKPALEQ